MRKRSQEADSDLSTTATLLQATIALLGFLMIAFSLSLDEEGGSGYLREILKETGIVVFAVFSISLLYERLLASRHQRRFLERLQQTIATGESNAAMCASLGIVKLFRDRHSYEACHPFKEVVSELESGGSLRVFGKTLFLTTTKSRELQKLLQGGVHIELCLFNPDAPAEELLRCQGLRKDEITTSLGRFKTEIADWVQMQGVKGSVTLKYHQLPMLDSFFHAKSSRAELEVWEWSFGTDLDDKRIVRLDPDQKLGLDVAARYQEIWSKCPEVFSYTRGRLGTNLLPG
jgi:hypothetical protein